MDLLPTDVRGKLSADTLIKVILVLVVVWLVLAIAEEFTDIVGRLLGPFDNLLGLLIVLVIVLWLLDRI